MSTVRRGFRKSAAVMRRTQRPSLRSIHSPNAMLLPFASSISMKRLPSGPAAHQRRCRHARPWAPTPASRLQIGHARPSQLPATHALKHSRCVAPPRRRRSSSVTGVRDAADCNLGKERRPRTHIRAGCVRPMGDRDGSRIPTRCRRTFCTWACPKCSLSWRRSPPPVVAFSPARTAASWPA